MVPIKTLLPELRKLVGELADDLLARSIGDAKIDAGLKEAFQQIERGGRTAQAFEVWREDYLDQVAVAWVLACVFVRFMEDNGLIEDCWLAGEGDRRRLAEDTHELFFRKNPQDTDREYFLHVFQEVGQIPAAKDLFAEGKTPLWAVAPSGDAAMKLLKFWREMDAETGHLQRSFQVESGDTRFLGDLYQELSERAKKKFALLQTPVFVEEFILDRTLTPALAEFGLEKVRMIDPTCGSGHFLLGGFARLFDLWSQRESNEIKAAQKALDGVWGVDINPFAVAIARFRLIVAAVQACGIKRIKQAPGWNIHLATGDSLLFGSRWDRAGKKKSEQQFLGTAEESWTPEIYACEDKEAISEALGQQYHAVVGNPPYITVKDSRLNQAYRDRYPTCFRAYSLGVPFTERFLDLALAGQHPGYMGMITANSFMKREFGKVLIEEYFPHYDLTHILDASGAYIPGHGTPTVILFGRNRRPVLETVRAVLGIRGEPDTPDDARFGKVWQSLLSHVDGAGESDDYTSSVDLRRSALASHPWSIGGGGAAEVKEAIQSISPHTLDSFVDVVGRTTHVGEDDVYFLPPSLPFTKGYSTFCVPVVNGEEVRDFEVTPELVSLFPYDVQTAKPVPLEALPRSMVQHFWTYRTRLKQRIDFGQTVEERGLRWFDHTMFFPARFTASCSLATPNIASHFHVGLQRRGKLFNSTAPVIQLLSDATLEDYQRMLAYLSSCLVTFWLKQVSHQKQLTGGDGVRVQSRAKVPYQYSGTQIRGVPLPEVNPQNKWLWEQLAELGKLADEAAIKLESLSGKNVVLHSLQDCIDPKSRWETAVEARAHLKSELVCIQEDIDFTVYAIFGLAEAATAQRCIGTTASVSAGERPFEILLQSNEEGFSVPATVPPKWPNDLQTLWRERIAAIENSSELKVIEDAHYKRRWIGKQGLFNQARRADEFLDALRNWLLDRLETPKYRKGTKDHPELTTTAQMADVASADAEFLQVAALYRGRPDFDVAALVAELVEAEAVPLLPILRYKPAGLRKREVWERTWDLQRQQDSGEDVGDIPVPPKYATADFLKTDYWRLRGKLDVPKERWISFPHCSTDSDPSLVVGWAGWDHLEQATALIAYYDARKREGWDAARLAPLLAGLDQLLPWIHQWHPEIDPEFGETAGQSFQALLENDAHELGLTVEAIRKWAPEGKGGRRKAKGGKTKEESPPEESPQ